MLEGIFVFAQRPKLLSSNCIFVTFAILEINTPVNSQVLHSLADSSPDRFP